MGQAADGFVGRLARTGETGLLKLADGFRCLDIDGLNGGAGSKQRLQHQGALLRESLTRLAEKRKNLEITTEEMQSIAKECHTHPLLFELRFDDEFDRTLLQFGLNSSLLEEKLIAEQTSYKDLLQAIRALSHAITTEECVSESGDPAFASTFERLENLRLKLSMVEQQSADLANVCGDIEMDCLKYDAIISGAAPALNMPNNPAPKSVVPHRTRRRADASTSLPENFLVEAPSIPLASQLASLGDEIDLAQLGLTSNMDTTGS